MTAALEGGEWSVAHPGRTLPLGKTRYPFYRRLGGPQGRCGWAENLVPTGIRSPTVQPLDYVILVSVNYPFTYQCILCVPSSLTIKTIRSAHTLYLCVLCGSENQQLLFPNTTITDRFLQTRYRVFTAFLPFHTNGRYISKAKKCVWALRGRTKRGTGNISCWGGSELTVLYKYL